MFVDCLLHVSWGMLIVKKVGGLGTFLPPFSIGYPVPTALHMIVGSDLFSLFTFFYLAGTY